MPVMLLLSKLLPPSSLGTACDSAKLVPHMMPCMKHK